ncbi:MAG TPA: biotin--[acetyl-CoA-carboxylase] ligase [Burkholderiaceae bacterium]|nr:biotin--[acetyl-CoA-carboxylase] ligase [Burkholderiaceae bacterium]
MRPLDQPAPLSASAIIEALGPEWRQACLVEAVASTVSTNEDLATRARAQQPSQLLLRAADFQHAGRGRGKRPWRAAAGDALLFSVAIPLSSSSQSLPAVTLACGVALAETLVERGVAVQLKWPNDIRVEGCKLGGILTELVSDRSARQTLVVGVGVNVRLDDRMRRSIGQPATALDQLPGVKGELREQWIGRLGGAICRAASQFIARGFEPFRERYNQMLESRGEVVDVQNVATGAPPLRGHLIEVDHQGRLVIDAGGQRHALNVGDVSIRR